MNKVLITISFLLLWTPVAWSSDSFHQTLAKANQDYEQGRYEEAREGYHQLLSQGSTSGHLHYNLGNAWFKEGDYAKAIDHYLKAQIRLPRNEDVRANLDMALRNTTDIWDGRRDSFASAILFWLKDFNLREHLQALAILNLLFWMAAGIRLVSNNESLAKAHHVLIALLILGILSTGFRWDLEHNTQVAVVGEKTLDIFSGKGKSSEVILQLHEGAILPVLDEKESWIELELPNGKKGWGPAHALLK